MVAPQERRPPSRARLRGHDVVPAGRSRRGADRPAGTTVTAGGGAATRKRTSPLTRSAITFSPVGQVWLSSDRAVAGTAPDAARA